ncbi:hypothetical protein TYRP_016643 [Tyrophagus putrescentiae]|nr:hypothetical protein TYRP_016643 [Tyrophagus putrescentiae]
MLAVHNTRRRGLASLVHLKLPLPRVLRAKRAGLEAAEVLSVQVDSGLPRKGSQNLSRCTLKRRVERTGLEFREFPVPNFSGTPKRKMYNKKA